MKQLLTLTLLALILVACKSRENEKIVFREAKYIANAVSPTITAIRQLPAADRETAIAELLEKGQSEGFPLLEAHSLNPEYTYATFIYTDPAPHCKIEFEVCGLYDEPRFGNQTLYRFDSTHIHHRTYLIPNDLCFAYRFIVNDTVTGERQTIPDPQNKALCPTEERQRFSWSVLDLRPDEPNWYTKRYEAGSRLDTFNITSGIMANTRNIYVYLPPGYDGSTQKYPVIYLFDSFIYLHRVEVPNVLDNLIREQKIEPMIAVFIDNPTGTSRLTELPLNPQFKEFIVTELVPRIKSNYRITDKPAETLIGGISYGGLAAAYIAFEHSSIFGKVLSQSGGFWRDLTLRDSGGAEYRGDWLIDQYLMHDKRDLKLFLDWGLQEDMCLGSGRRFVKALHQKGYICKFIEFNGWHDWSNSRKTFPEGLLYLTENN